MALAHAHAELAEVNEGAVTAAARTILAGLGFSQDDAERPVADFSGGWRNRIALARALMCPADLLLLDEPTNHLDIDSLIWLENWLRHVEATVIIISHDREFLDRAVTTIWSVEDDTIRRYAGNFTKFEAERMERLRQQDAAHRAYEAKAASLRSFIDRFRAKATKARQAQSRIKMLEKLESVEAVRAKREWRFEFPKPVRLPEHLADAEGLACGYDDLVILRGVTFGALGRADRRARRQRRREVHLIKTVVAKFRSWPGTAPRPGSGDRLLRAASARSAPVRTSRRSNT